MNEGEGESEFPMSAEPPPRYEPPAPPNHAESRPGNTAPHPPATDPSWAAMGRMIDDTLIAARNLFRIARNPHNDALWPILKPNLLRIEAILQRAINDRPDDSVAAVMLDEVRTFLGRRMT